MSILAWLVVGFLAGVLARWVTGTPSRGCLATTAVGIIGRSWAGPSTGSPPATKTSAFDDFDLGSVVVAMLGAVLLLLVLEALGRGARTRLSRPGRRRTRRWASPQVEAIGLTAQIGRPLGWRHDRRRDRRSRPLPHRPPQRWAVDGAPRRSAGRRAHRARRPLGHRPAEVGQVVTGCVSQVGEQAFNIGRTAWLSARLPLTTAATTVDTQCGSSQQATNVATSLVGSGVVDVAIACGVELMSRVPIGSNSNRKLGLGVPIPKPYFGHYEFTSQFEGAERIADKWGVTRADTDEFGLASQQRAATAWAEGRFDTQVVPVDAPDVDDEGTPTGTTHRVERDEGLRDTSLEALANLKPVARPDGVHGRQLLADQRRRRRGAGDDGRQAGRPRPHARARVVDTCLVGVDPVLMLTGPIDATQRLLERTGMAIGDIDVFEINEAFASVVLAWQQVGADLDTRTPTAAPSPSATLGGTGAFLVTKAVHELQRTDGSTALVSMCCGGGLGTGTILERL